MNTYEAIQQRVSALAAEFPALGLTFGYIGNVSRFGDDRGWRVFTKVRTAEGRSVSWGDWSSNDLPAMQAAIDSGRLRLFCESAAKKYTPAPAPARVYDPYLAKVLDDRDFSRTVRYGNSAQDARRDAENRAAEELADPPTTSDAEWRALMAAALDNKPADKDDDDIPF